MGMFRRRSSESNVGQAQVSTAMDKNRSYEVRQGETREPMELEHVFARNFKIMLKQYYEQQLHLIRGESNGSPTRILHWMTGYPHVHTSLLQEFFEDSNQFSNFVELHEGLNLRRAPGVREEFSDLAKLRSELLPAFEKQVQSMLLATGLHRKIIQPTASLRKEDHRAIKHSLRLFDDGHLPAPRNKKLAVDVAHSTVGILLDRNADRQAQYIVRLHEHVGLPKDDPSMDYAVSIAKELANIRQGGLSHSDDLEHIRSLGNHFYELTKVAPKQVDAVFNSPTILNLFEGVMREHTEAVTQGKYIESHTIELLGAVSSSHNLTPEILKQNTKTIISQRKVAEAMTSGNQSKIETESPKGGVENNDEVPVTPHATTTAEKISAGESKLATKSSVNTGASNIKIVHPMTQEPIGPSIRITFKNPEQAKKDIRATVRGGVNIAAATTVAGAAVFSAAPQAAASTHQQQTMSKEVHAATPFVAQETPSNIASQTAPMVEAISQAPGTLTHSARIKIEDGPSERRVTRPEASMQAKAEVDDRGDNVRAREIKQQRAMGSVPVEVIANKQAPAGAPGIQVGIADALAEVAPQPLNVQVEASTISMESRLEVPGAQQAPARQVGVAPIAATVTSRPIEDVYAKLRTSEMGVNQAIQERREAAYVESGAEGMTLNDLIKKYESEYSQQGLSLGEPSVELTAKMQDTKIKLQSGAQTHDSKEAFARLEAALKYPDMLNPGALDQRFMVIPAELNGRKLTEAEVTALNNYIIQATPKIKSQFFASSDDVFYDDSKKDVFARGLIISDILNINDQLVRGLVNDFTPKVSRTEVRPPAPKAPEQQAPAPSGGGEVMNGSELLEKTFLQYGVPKEYIELYIKYGNKFKIDPRLLVAQGDQESFDDGKRFNPRADSEVGARGLLQAMPDTWTEIVDELGLPSGASPENPNYAIMGQAHYLRKMLNATDGNVTDALRGYNAGLGNIRKNWREPRIYVEEITENLSQIKKIESKIIADAKPKPAPKTPEAPKPSGVRIHTGNAEAQAQLNSILNKNKNTGAQLWEQEEPMLEKALKKAGHNNGRLSDDQLISVDNRGHKLHKTAGRAYLDMVAAYERETGRKDMRIMGENNSTAYRTLAKQKEIKRESGRFAAKPGTSNHGWGLAIDLDMFGGNGFETPQYKWLINNAHRFGYFHSFAHAKGASTPEPWHWNFLLKDY